jgi:hypothetical protein
MNFPKSESRYRIVSLVPYDTNGKKMPYHITIAKIKINSEEADKLEKNLNRNWNDIIGKNEKYTINFAGTMWGSNSILTQTISHRRSVDIDNLREGIYDFLSKKYEIDISRHYNDLRPGLPPQHINVSGDKSFIDKKMVVTLSFSVY